VLSIYFQINFYWEISSGVAKSIHMMKVLAIFCIFIVLLHEMDAVPHGFKERAEEKKTEESDDKNSDAKKVDEKDEGNNDDDNSADDVERKFVRDDFFVSNDLSHDHVDVEKRCMACDVGDWGGGR